MELTVIEENVQLEIVDTTSVTGPIISNGGGGAVSSVNGYIGDVVLSYTDTGAAPLVHNHAITDVVNLTAQLAAKAADDQVVKVTGDQSVGGVKTFTQSPVVPDGSFAIAKTTNLQSTLDAKVALTGAQTIAGVKTFSSAPVVPAASFAIAATSGLQTALDGKAALSHTHAQSDVTGLSTSLAAKADDTAVVKLTGAQTVAGVKTFSSAPVVPSGSFAIAATTNLQSTLDAKVALTGAQTIAGVKTFSSSPVVPDGSFAISAVTNLQTTLNGKASDVHTHQTTDIDSATPFSTAYMPDAYQIVVVKADDIYGAAGSWPASRPGSTDQYVHFIGDTDPGSIALDYDLWTQV